MDRRPSGQRALDVPSVWQSLGTPLIGLIFAASVVLCVAYALALLGFSGVSVVLVSIPAAIALLAQAAWMQTRWRIGLLGMLLSLGVFWCLIILGSGLL